ncbi:MAG: YkgJ family cysteine cluster protein [Candidatus Marinarcus sp.]|uniref:YkgJ family cysteine cluster protein n=1 Tax=Candidatus Marinarcus sp. TaxID=3100987 RepID=UPI003B009995
MSELIKQEGYSYSFDCNACSKCEGNCCIGESGYIWISKDEIVTLAKFMSVSVEELAQKYLMKVGYKYSIKEVEVAKGNYACMFFDLEKKQCSVYEARPTQCRTFPFWEYFKNNEDEVYKECPAVKAI